MAARLAQRAERQRRLQPRDPAFWTALDVQRWEAWNARNYVEPLPTMTFFAGIWRIAHEDIWSLRDDEAELLRFRCRLLRTAWYIMKFFTRAGFQDQVRNQTIRGHFLNCIEHWRGIHHHCLSQSCRNYFTLPDVDVQPLRERLGAHWDAVFTARSTAATALTPNFRNVHNAR